MKFNHSTVVFRHNTTLPWSLIASKRHQPSLPMGIINLYVKTTPDIRASSLEETQKQEQKRHS